MKKAIAVIFALVCAALALTGCAGGREEKNTTKMTTAATTRVTTAQSTSETTRETTSAQTTAETTQSVTTASDTGSMTSDSGNPSETTMPVPGGLIPEMTTGSSSDGPAESDGTMGSGN
ncbi:MAG: hypothetical protein IKM29_00775 [Clostridia bacterium]|nr:hypothetical protein [Clostridia bacterium]